MTNKDNAMNYPCGGGLPIPGTCAGWWRDRYRSTVSWKGDPIEENNPVNYFRADRFSSPPKLRSANHEVSISLEEKAALIHERVLTIDTHNDTPMLFTSDDFDFGLRNGSPGSPSQVDLPRMVEGGLDAGFFAVFIGQGERTPQGNQQAQEKTLQIFDSIHKVVIKNSEAAQLAFSSEDAYHIEKRGKRAIYMGIENGYPIGTDLSLIQTYYDLGARYITL